MLFWPQILLGAVYVLMVEEGFGLIIMLREKSHMKFYAA